MMMIDDDDDADDDDDNLIYKAPKALAYEALPVFIFSC